MTPSRRTALQGSWTPAEAIHEMLSWNGHFDEYVLAAFVRSVGVYPVGSLVRIPGDRLAIVIETHRKHPERPTVRAFASTTPGVTIEPEDINLAETQEDILSFERPADWDLHDWEERWPELPALRSRTSRREPGSDKAARRPLRVRYPR
jgi:hypothetical protein